MKNLDQKTKNENGVTIMALAITIIVLLITVISAVPPIITYYVIDNGVLRFFLICIISVTSTLSIGFFIGFNAHERTKIMNKISSFVKNKVQRYK